MILGIFSWHYIDPLFIIEQCVCAKKYYQVIVNQIHRIKVMMYSVEIR